MEQVLNAVRAFFASSTLSPHGICLLWRPELIWTHATSDIVIGLAYFSIPLAISAFLYQRPDVKFGWVLWMFVAFIMLCGLTHFMAVWTLWKPDYAFEALLKVATAIASLLTAAALWPLLPKVSALPAAATLQARIDERDKALMELRAAMATMVEMREHETRQKLLLDELNHRVKNTLASVQSIAAQTLRGANDIGEFKISFVDRLMALSSTHDLLVKREWANASLRELTEATLRHYGLPFAYAGPDLRLQSNLAVTLGMALHELATNAVKYGAWAGGGRIDIEVAPTQSGRAVRIVWRESGGRPVTAPTGHGFGSRLLEQGVAGELGGKVTLDWRPEGLVCVIEAPVSEKIALETATAA
ncbi:sensor histidine kinase [Phenylobacterium sp.]|uniref:sensor histidine kinase n=1 Tax=Phenylobacterium sp. TaxID=1871053 RepID=UPI0012241697|nr:sensor histidine kinase [Phenylobacterium sp.]THD60725.1 MAG: sensor histidine kinase [Phenylobacterium sp.]